MRYRKLSPTGDYTFGQSQDNFWVNVPEAVAQAILTGLKLWLGEWYLDTSLGVPYIQGVIGKHPQSTADQTIRTQIENVQGVVDIVTFESEIDPVARKYSVTKCVVNTIYGPTAIQVANYVNF